MTNQDHPAPPLPDPAELWETVRDLELLERQALELSRNATREHTHALNALNKAQAEVDNALEQARKAAPRESDWFRQERGQA